MISRTSEYALRAVVYLAQHEERWPIPGGEIAGQLEIPSRYLSSILSILVRAGVLEASRGKSGGFRLATPPGDTRLVEVLGPFENFGDRHCPFGNPTCSDEEPCLAHERWKKVKGGFERFLDNTSIRDIALKKGESKKTRARRSARPG